MPQTAFAQSVSMLQYSTLAEDFHRLATLVRQSRPETVVLVARKMPRLCSALSLDFGSAHIISDMAIPLSESILRSHRVAIVDDFINVGSTIDRVDRMIREFGAVSIERFAIASRSSAADEKNQPFLVHKDPLRTEDYRAIVSALPRVFDTAAEAYDLEFPHMPCSYSWTVPDMESLIELLRQEFGAEAVHRVPGTAKSNTRVTLTLPFSPNVGLRKIRFYEATSSEGFIAVPISVPSHFGDGAARSIVDSGYQLLQTSSQLETYLPC